MLALCALCGAGALLAASEDRASGPPGARASGPPDAFVIDCRDRISEAFTEVGGVTRPYRFRVRPRRDTVIGPVAFSGALGYDDAVWDDLVRTDDWLKSIALVRRGTRVTLEVPPGQRAWMRLQYAHSGAGAGSARAVSLAGCRRPATRAECGSGPRTTCRSRVTPFSGGFEVDYARAPRQGRCAELIVWVDGNPLRARLYPDACRT